MSRTQKLKELVAASLILKTLNDNPYLRKKALSRKIMVKSRWLGKNALLRLMMIISGR